MCAPCLMTVSCIMMESFTNAPFSITTPRGEDGNLRTVPETTQPGEMAELTARAEALIRTGVRSYGSASAVWFVPYVAVFGRQPGIGLQEVPCSHPSKPESSPRPSSTPRKDNRRRGPLLRPWG